MATALTGESSARPAEDVDPHGYLTLGMRVLGGQSAYLGTIETLERDAATGRLSALVVRHGLFGSKRTLVPTKQVKWVNQDSVVLQLTRPAFKRHPHLTHP